jgi:vancomycin resistance protein VanW
MHGLILGPGEIFSFWHLVGPPEEKNGYKEGATFIKQRVSASVGGGLCQLSGLIHNLALLSGCRILERHNHSIDAYGNERYVPLGRDATVAHPQLDLCFRNPHPFPLLMTFDIQPDQARGWILSTQPLPHEIRIEVTLLGTYPSPSIEGSGLTLSVGSQTAEKGFDGHKVSTRRIFVSQGKVVRDERLGTSYYRPTPSYSA